MKKVSYRGKGKELEFWVEAGNNPFRELPREIQQDCQAVDPIHLREVIKYSQC